MVTIEPITLPDCARGKLAFVMHNVYSRQECDQMVSLTSEIGYAPAMIDVGSGRQEVVLGKRNSDRCIVDDHAKAAELLGRLEAHLPATWEHRRLVGINERLRYLRYRPGQHFGAHYDGQYVRENGERSFITLQLYLRDVAPECGGATRFIDQAAHIARIQANAQPPNHFAYRETFWESEDEEERDDHRDNSSSTSVQQKPSSPTLTMTSAPKTTAETASVETDAAVKLGALSSKDMAQLQLLPEDKSVDIQPRAGSVLVFQHDIWHCGCKLVSGEKFTVRTDVMYAAEEEKTTMGGSVERGALADGHTAAV